MYEVIYFSRSGNTRKVANAIAEELNAKARHIRSVPILAPGADLFLGSGLYLLRPSKEVRDFIQNNDFKGRKVALFGTSATGIGIETAWMERQLKRRGAIICGKYYCAGKIFFIRQNRPSPKDLEKAREFARAVKKGICQAGSRAGGYGNEQPDHYDSERVGSRAG
jgi:flavodoxin